MDIGNRKYKGSDGFLRNANTAQRQASFATKSGFAPKSTEDDGEALEETVLYMLTDGEMSFVELTNKKPDVDKDMLEQVISRLERRSAVEAIRGEQDVAYKITDVGERALKLFRLSKKS